MRETCGDCILSRFDNDGSSKRVLDSIRVHPYVPEDRKKVMALPCGQEIMKILRQEHVQEERCAALRVLLPTVEDTPVVHPFALCAEVALVDQIAEEFLD